MKTLTKKQAMYEQIEKHGEDLKRAFDLPSDTDAVKLCKSLLRLERKAHHAVTCLCNTNTLHLTEFNQYNDDTREAKIEEQALFFSKILSKVYKLLGDEAEGKVFVNYDPRGYALKIRSEHSKDMDIYKDWGGYGIIAPNFRV